MSRSRLGRRSCLAVLALLLAGWTILVTPSSAGADGSAQAQLAQLVVKDPIPGWTKTSDDELAPVIAEEQRVEQAAAEGLGASATVAVSAWTGPSAGSRLIISLIKISFKGSDQSRAEAAVAVAVNTAAASACVGAQAQPAGTKSSVDGVPASVEQQCTTPGGLAATAVAFSRGNILAIEIGLGVDKPILEPVTRAQYSALPATATGSGASGSASGGSATAGGGDTTGDSSSSSSNTGIWIGVGIGVVVALVALLFLARASRAKRSTATAVPPATWGGPTEPTPAWGGQPPTAPPLGPPTAPIAPTAWAAPPTAPATPAGWYPDPSSPATQRYWDGTSWTTHVHPPVSAPPTPPPSTGGSTPWGTTPPS